MALTNNDVLKKIRVALKLRDDDIIEILALVDFKVTKSEIGAFFRKEGHPNYMELQDQILRNFLNGLVIYKRGPMDESVEKTEKAKPAAATGAKPKPSFKPKSDYKPKSDFKSKPKSNFKPKTDFKSKPKSPKP